MTIPIYCVPSEKKKMVSIRGILQYKRSCRVLLAELIDLLSKEYELNIIDLANNSVSYVCVPKTSSNWSFQNSKEWVYVAIKVTKHGGTYEAAYRITNHVLCFYQDSVLAACQTQRLPVSKPMTATQFFSKNERIRS